ncbi:PREDICTED: 1-phosphatidylinositol-3-phosphate 5-kinase FAB1B-like isoform X3 [Populus euphratica]|uniref:1-phosphatidylinositol-3-phosphate 5-kinase n=1 Tax=Populus euphratica TaxID=75702 RepID=A0AAJ6UWC5_POPEU|nr:PREDICTED: 1-phosphatidylinositol-3-phosphate 5-kinase FAB1B-like isoform X3 [Populus euphratica]
MESSDKTFSELICLLKSWIPWRSEPASVSRDFWMPDQSCRVCYECDSQFTVFNRRHHCRLCGRVFCAKCTANSVPVPSCDPGAAREEWEKIRVCNYCFRQWQQGLATSDNGIQVPCLDFSTSPSAASFISTRSSSTANSSSITLGSMPYLVKPNQQAQTSSSLSPQASEMETSSDKQGEVASARSKDPVADIEYRTPDGYTFSINRSDDDDDEYGAYRSDSETRQFPQVNDYYHQVEFDDMGNDGGSDKGHLDGETVDPKSSSSSPLNHSFGSQNLEGRSQLRKKDEHEMDDECEAPSSMYSGEDGDTEPVDFENNGALWLPPEPEDEEDEREVGFFEDDDDDKDAAGEWGYLRASGSFGSGEFRNRDRSGEERKKVMKNVVDGHFRALVSQLLQVENVPVGDENDKESWLEIITSLSWEAATLLKPDTSKGGGMDPGGYVKVKCIASGRRCESMVVRGVVCKKNIAHRRMTSKIEKPRLLILGGALEYQRVSNHLSSFDTLLQQEMDHLKMAVAKIDAHNPDVLLVENSVSRHAQEYLLAKDISLVLNIKRPLLERIARCTGAQIVPSVDHLSSPKLGYCEKFHVERILEDLGTAGHTGKKLVKTLMYFEGCPKPLGFTILLRGANGDELKKVKHVVQYGVFAAYHLALETSFLADEGASLPELPLNTPITVALPDKPSSIERSISTVPGFTIAANEKPQGLQSSNEPQRSNSAPTASLVPTIISSSVDKVQAADGLSTQSSEFTQCRFNSTEFLSAFPYTVKAVSDSYRTFEEKNIMDSGDSLVAEIAPVNNGLAAIGDQLNINGFGSSDGVSVNFSQSDFNEIIATHPHSSEVSSAQQDSRRNLEESEPLKEEFPPSPSDHQSILVSLSSRCVWKGTVCERSHLIRFKYYGNFDKPLGRFLRDHLFDQSYSCRSCEMPSEAHVHCYTHRQGTLTISVKKLPEILLPGEKDGKIWMWHRCLMCPRISGFPPATRRVVMSDAAWGLSFGKFLELSFSNHAAASRVASCGHSLHRDCLRFYGFGKMVACFRYASINVLSVYLPPAKVDFSSENQEWTQKETDEVVNQAELLFSEVLNALSQISERRCKIEQNNSGMKLPESRRQIAEFELMLQKEKVEFEESLHKVMNKELKNGQSVIDILEINRLRRQLLFQSYMWDNRLVYAASLDNNSFHDGSNSSTSGQEEKPLGPANSDKLIEENVDAKLLKASNQQGGFGSNTNQCDADGQETDVCQGPSHGKGGQANPFAAMPARDLSDIKESGGSYFRTLSDGQDPVMANLSDTLDAAWTGENQPGSGTFKDDNSRLSDSAVEESSTTGVGLEGVGLEGHVEDQVGSKVCYSPSPALSTKDLDNMEHSVRKLKLQDQARRLLPVGVNDTVIPVYDDEPTSLISYALASQGYHAQLTDEGEREKESGDFSAFLSSSDTAFPSFDETSSDSYRSFGSTDESILSMSGSRGALILDPLFFTKAMHARVSFGDDSPVGKARYSVTCYYAKRFEALRRVCCPSELDYIRSLSRCKKWGAQGGKSNVFFAKTLDDRFIIKQVTKTELESFIKFAPAYFRYLSDSISSRSPTCLAKILGIYQVTSKLLKGGKETKMDVLVMENLLYRRKVTRLYDLKGSSRSRYNSDSSGSNKVLLDQNLIEAMPTSPIFVGNKAKRLLERAVWNDTSFLASIDVMDYSLLVGVDEEKHELVLGIIDFMRQYTWDKHLETWVKATRILGGPKNASPTVISPKQYKKRFRKAMTTYFLMVPDQWYPPTIIPSKSQSDFAEENTQGATSVD